MKAIHLFPRSIFLAAGLAAVGALPLPAGVIYDNLPGPGEGVGSTGASPRVSGGDDCSTGNTLSYYLTGVRFGYAVSATTGPANFDARIRLWDDFSSSSTSTDPVFLNLVADFNVPFTGQTSGSFLSSLINIPGSPMITGGDWAFQIGFYQPGTSTLVPSDGVTFIFDFSGVNVGAGEDVYWRDVNNDGTLQVGEGRYFGGPPNLANFALQFEGTVVPEPSAFGMILMGAFAILGLRLKRQSR